MGARASAARAPLARVQHELAGHGAGRPFPRSQPCSACAWPAIRASRPGRPPAGAGARKGRESTTPPPSPPLVRACPPPHTHAEGPRTTLHYAPLALSYLRGAGDGARPQQLGGRPGARPERGGRRLHDLGRERVLSCSSLLSRGAATTHARTRGEWGVAGRGGGTSIGPMRCCGAGTRGGERGARGEGGEKTGRVECVDEESERERRRAALLAATCAPHPQRTRACAAARTHARGASSTPPSLSFSLSYSHETQTAPFALHSSPSPSPSLPLHPPLHSHRPAQLDQLHLLVRQQAGGGQLDAPLLARVPLGVGGGGVQAGDALGQGREGGGKRGGR